MGLLNIFKKRPRAEPTNIPTGRISGDGNYYKTLSPFRSRTNDILADLRRIPDEISAIEYLAEKNPDVSMAVWNFIRLANQGHSMKFYDLKGNVVIEIESQWRDFASRINSISNAGLDGLIDIFHYNGIVKGLQMCEVEVLPDLSDIAEVHPIDPKTITWELEDREGKKVWIPYQQNFTKKVDLSKGNIFYVPLDPTGENPRGTLSLSPALQAVDYQLQALQDMAAVLRRQGYPRADIEIDRESFIKSLPANIKNDPKKLEEALDKYFYHLRDVMRQLEPTDDYIHYNDTKINQGGSANPARSMDIRAFNEMTDIQVISGLKQLGTFLNRHTGKTETYSSVEFKIVTKGIESLQRGSKRLVEEIARLWLRVNGVQAVPVFTHNVVDYTSEQQRLDIKLSEQDFYANAVRFGWITNDMAAQEVMGVEKAVGKMPTGNGGDNQNADNN